ncbi:threonine--tRNA ligase [Edaphobacter albus]|uniref:threonine--tRNA ligase n=1 Tax=Edaphobacter sp. 4G125 TaxID=2763071 RepID=UPI00164543D4|nr:threonine--tRNA ligase [Edaphobacter sp. 4G125]QNI36024.1 threonine--tRNA ligase [Edaphobacter sp. 4G125]
MLEIDHRVIGVKLGLFHQQVEGPGMVFWHPRGWQLYRIIEDYIRDRMREMGFSEVRTPQLLARSLWEESGHWDKFGKDMYSVTDHDAERALCLKPMSCPCHIQLFNKHIRSYNELPLRYCEFGNCHRDEPSGSLHGLMRTRAFTQDDAHVFCAESQLVTEIGRFCQLLRRVYQDFGFGSYTVALSTRPPHRMGSEQIWDRAEEALANAASAAEVEFELRPGEGAFYGPKLEFHLMDGRGRSWQCGTVQLDFFLPERLNARFINDQGRQEIPVMIHHAILGSIERFIGILLEHYEGWLPNWLAPEPLVVSTITTADIPYALEVAADLKAAGLRVSLDTRAERLGRKIMDARDKCIPLMIVLGARDARERTISLRHRNGAQEVYNLDDSVPVLRNECGGPLAFRGKYLEG